MAGPVVRAPRYKRWVGTGAVVGLLLGVALTAAFRSERSSFGAAALYLGLAGVLVGAVAGGLVALVVDRPDVERRDRR